MLQGTDRPFVRLTIGVESGSLKLIDRVVGSLWNWSDPLIPWIVVDVGVDVIGIDADVGRGGGCWGGNGGCHCWLVGVGR